ncbi:MAG: sulfatase [Myxococcota bacterium]
MSAVRHSALLFRLLVACAIVGCSAPSPRALILISLDTTRRDHLGAYGYARDTTPSLDRLASEGVVFESAFAQDTNTDPSHTSMLTGLYPHTHGSLRNGTRLRRGVTTLAQVLGSSGFATGGFVTGLTMLARTTGLDRGFDVYEDRFQGRRRDGRVAVALARRWLREHARGRYFLFLHLFDAHGPYRPKGRYATLFHSEGPPIRLTRIPSYQRTPGPDGRLSNDLHRYVDRYDAMLRYNDDRISDLLEALELRDVLVVVTADHGETLGERYQKLDHGGQVFDEQIRVPLVMRGPGLPPHRVEAPVESVDLVPTLLELLGVAPPAGLELEGGSLVPLLREDAGAERAAADRTVFSTARAVSARHADRGYRLDPSRRIASIRGSRWKLIVYPASEGDRLELYDLSEDPGETHNVAEDHPRVRDAYRAELERWQESGSGASGTRLLSPELHEQLRELGYAD